MNQSQAWLRQAKADYDAAYRVVDRQDASTYCQAIAKYQQSVEKSIKGMVAAVNDLGVSFHTITELHSLDKEIKALQTLRWAIDNTSVERITRVFSKKRLNLIQEITALAPHYPRDGKTFVRNTEYPFTLASGEWTAPASEGVFTMDEVNRYQSLARELYQNISSFTSGVRLGRQN